MFKGEQLTSSELVAVESGPGSLNYAFNDPALSDQMNPSFVSGQYNTFNNLGSLDALKGRIAKNEDGSYRVTGVNDTSAWSGPNDFSIGDIKIGTVGDQSTSALNLSAMNPSSAEGTTRAWNPLRGAWNLGRQLGNLTGAQSESNPNFAAGTYDGQGQVMGTTGLTFRGEKTLAQQQATPSVSRDFANLAAMSNNLGPSISTRDTFTRGLGVDTKALRRNQFSSSPNSNLDRSLAQVSGALKSTSDQVAQQANLGISGYLSQANEQRAAAQKHLATIRGGRTDLAAEIAKLKEGYSDVDVDTKGLEELEGQYATAETDITKQLSDYDQNVRGYVTQWQQSTQTPQWTMGVKAKGNIYKSPLQQFGRKARTTSRKIQTPGSEFTIGGLASAWNPTLNI